MRSLLSATLALSAIALKKIEGKVRATGKVIPIMYPSRVECAVM